MNVLAFKAPALPWAHVWLAVLVILLAGRAAIVSAQAPAIERKPETLAPFVPTPEAVVERMLKLADVRPDDTVYDLGCGDGRIVIMAAQKFDANAVGVELDPGLYRQALERVKALKLQDKVKIISGDLLLVDLRPATVVTLSLLTSANRKLKPNLEKFLRKGSRVVSHDFEVPGWKADRIENASDEREFRQHIVYLYRR
jgi:SAM-dependent methyltransferase